jgi:DNA mismatch repair protein MutS2
MDAQSLKSLEYDKIKTYLSEFTISEMGKKLALSIIPFNDEEIIKKKLRIVSQFKEIIESKNEFPIYGLKDISSSIKKAQIEGAILDSSDIYAVAVNIEIGKNIKTFLFDKKDQYPEIYSIVQKISALKVLFDRIIESIDEDGTILDKASPELKKLRKEIIIKEEEVRTKLNKILKQFSKLGYTREDLVTIKDGRGVIPIKEEYVSKIKGIIHHRSSTGFTLFVEPIEIIDMNNYLEELKSKEEREIRKILKELTDNIRENIQQIIENCEILAEVDLYYAQALFSIKINAKEPFIHNRHVIEIINGKHPILLLKKSPDDVVPLTVKIGGGLKTLIISGPNAGGKTVALKTIGILSLMAQSGMHIPADEDTKLPVFQKIFCEIGDEQSIEKDLSTFSSHLKRYKEFITDTSEFNLTLIDEIGTGTDPKEGCSIAMAILEKLTDSNGLTVVTTHQSALKVFAYNKPGIENGSMIFDEENLKPTYQFRQGIPGSSYAFEISKRLNFPEDILKRSNELFGEQENRIENMIKELQESIKKINEEKSEIDYKKSELDKLIKQYQTKVSSLKEFSREKKEEALKEAEKILESSNQAIEKAIQEIKIASANKESIKKAKEIVSEQKKFIKKELQEIKEPIFIEKNIAIGDKVLHREPYIKGEVISIPDPSGRVKILVDGKKIETNIEKLEKIDKFDKEIKSKLDKIPLVDIKDQIDLRGMDSIDACYALDKYLDEAKIMGISEARIIHGKGTGVLRKKVNEFLKNNPKIKSKRSAQWNEGGDGVTIVEL